MAYTKITLQQDLQSLGVSKIEELGDYCWRAYDSAYRSVGDQVIGRMPHLTAAGLYEKVAEIVDKGTMFDAGAQGNLLKMDKWACVINDSWVLGGVHRRAAFRLASPRVLENLWNANQGFFIVTARELVGLLNFGYAQEQIGPYAVLKLRNPERAAAANLIEYDRLIKSGQTFRNAIDLIDKKSPHARLMQEIRGRRSGG